MTHYCRLRETIATVLEHKAELFCVWAADWGKLHVLCFSANQDFHVLGWWEKNARFSSIDT